MVSFWHPIHIEEIRQRIDAAFEEDPRIMIPVFRKGTKRLTKVLLVSRFYLDDTIPNHDPGRTDKMDITQITTAKVAVS